MDREKTGALIAAARREKQMTQKELAEALHVSDRAVSKWERAAGFPDVSLLEPLADALGLSVLDLLRGERAEDGADSDRQVREAVRIVAGEARRRARRALRIVKIGAAVLLAALLAFQTYEFLATNGDGFHPFDNPRVLRQGYESNCRSLPGWGVRQIEISAPDRYTVLTDPEDIAALLDAVAQIEVQGTYRDWGPDSLDVTLRAVATGWTTEDGQFRETERETVFLLTFPAFTAGLDGDEPEFYFRAEIGGEDAWTVLEETLDELAGLT